MKSVELLWFENTSIVDEKIFPLPVLGGVGLRQFILLTLTFVSSYVLFKSTGEYLSWLPLMVGLLLIFKTEHVVPFEEKLFRYLMFYLSGFGIGSKGKKSKIKFAKLDKHKLSIAATYDTTVDSSSVQLENEIKVRPIYEKIGTPLKLTLTLPDSLSRPVVNVTAKILLDDVLLSTVKTDNYGRLAVVFTPQSAGEKLLEIRVDETVILQEILDVKGTL